MRTMRWVLVLMLAVGCGRGRESSVPPPAPSLLAPSSARATLEVALAPVEPGVAPLAVAIRMGSEVWRIGPLQQWRTTLPAVDGAGPLWVDPLGSDPPAFYPLSVGIPSGSLSLPLVPRVRLASSVYRELIDLLQEFIAPFEGSRVRRWDHRPVSVSLPAGVWPVDYAAACREAIEAWNAALGGAWLVAVDALEPADVECRVEDSERLAFTRLLATDEAGRPTSMRVQLSPRWVSGAERFVRRAYLHEFGHVLGLWGHSQDLAHVINGRAVIRDEIHPEERRCMLWLWALPEDFDLVELRRPTLDRPSPGPVVVTRCATAMERGIAANRPR